MRLVMLKFCFEFKIQIIKANIIDIIMNNPWNKDAYLTHLSYFSSKEVISKYVYFFLYYLWKRCSFDYFHKPSNGYWCARTRPRYGEECKPLFDGNVCFWASLEFIETKISYKNIPAGTLEMKPIVVDKDVYRKMRFRLLVQSVQLNEKVLFE